MAPLRPSIREIERKFTFDRNCVQKLFTNSGHPPFAHLTPLKRSVFEDTYYDTPSRVLSKNPTGGIWLRTRDRGVTFPGSNLTDTVNWPDPGSISKTLASTMSKATSQLEWELKQTTVSSAGYKAAGYHELKTVPEITKLLSKYLHTTHLAQGPEKKFGLEVYCKYITERIEFTADKKFTVALDKTDFGHDVGEVEVLAEIKPGPEGQKEEKEVLQEIEKWMDMYKWLFKSGKGEPKGKMTVYFEKFGGW